MRGQRDKHAAEEAVAAGQAVQIIDISEHQPRRIPSAKWRELIKKVWEADPLLCPKCQKEMRIVSLIAPADGPLTLSCTESATGSLPPPARPTDLKLFFTLEGKVRRMTPLFRSLEAGMQPLRRTERWAPDNDQQTGLSA